MASGSSSQTFVNSLISDTYQTCVPPKVCAHHDSAGIIPPHDSAWQESQLSQLTSSEDLNLGSFFCQQAFVTNCLEFFESDCKICKCFFFARLIFDSGFFPACEVRSAKRVRFYKCASPPPHLLLVHPCQIPIAKGIAGPQQPEYQKECPKILSDKMPEQILHRMPERMAEKMPKCVADIYDRMYDE